MSSSGNTVSAAFGFIVFTALSIGAIYTGQVWALEYTVPMAAGSAFVLMDAVFQ